MGIFDKLKNALFEEEYVEVEEKPRVSKQTPKKSKVRENVKEDIKEKYRNKDEDYDEEKPVAKKVVLPEKKENFVDSVEEVIPDNFEVETPIVEEPVPTGRRQFRVMEEEDFSVDEMPRRYQPEVEPQIVKVIEKESVPVSKAYQTEKENLYHGRIPNQPYGSVETPKTTVGDYRTYETRIEEKTHFKPSPIISPIYGVLDKNYKKEDVVNKREVKFTSNFAKEKLNVDEIRQKAFGASVEEMPEESKRNVVKPTFEVETTSNLLVDLSSDDSKPTVKDVTVGDAVEYFEDLGLEYNVDYLDASKKASGRRVKDDYQKEEDSVTFSSKKHHEEPQMFELKDDSLDDDDNLFDLIDSMYQEQ